MELRVLDQPMSEDDVFDHVTWFLDGEDDGDGVDGFCETLKTMGLDQSDLETASTIALSLLDKYEFDKIEMLDMAIQRRISDLCASTRAPHAPPIHNAGQPQVAYNFHHGKDLGLSWPRA